AKAAPPTREIQPASQPVQLVPQEPLKFLTRRQQTQMPTAAPTPRPADQQTTMFPGERQAKIVKATASSETPTAKEPSTLAQPPSPHAMSYPGTLADYCTDGNPMAPPFSAVGWIDSA